VAQKLDRVVVDFFAERTFSVFEPSIYIDSFLTDELLKDYCPYSSDNCGCSSGCTDCDYGLYTYTTKNRSKLKSKVKQVYVKSSNGFRPLKASERTAISLSTRNVSRNEKAKYPKSTYSHRKLKLIQNFEF